MKLTKFYILTYYQIMIRVNHIMITLLDYIIINFSLMSSP